MKIVLIGSGNIATHLGKAILKLEQHQLIQVYSKTLANAEALANVLSVPAIADLADLQTDADLYILAVSDAAIASVSDSLPKDLKGIVIHCSGATPMEQLHNNLNHGVIYPIQSFSKTIDVDLQQVPLGVEGSTDLVESKLTAFAKDLSKKVFPCSTEQRLAIHVAAVFANNFTNALFQVSYELMEQHGLSFDLIRPIILETAEKVQKQVPALVQTGPAVRNDEITMQRHLQFISSNPDWQLIYQQISALITKRKGKKGEN